MGIYRLDPPPDVTLKDLTDLFVLLQVHIDNSMFVKAPDNVKRLFKPSVLGESPSNMVN